MVRSIVITALLLSLPLPAQQAAAVRPTFKDIAPDIQFPYVTNNHYTGRKFFPQPMCGGIAIFDYDNDGLMDIFFTNGARLPELKKTDASFYQSLLRNLGNGTFTDVTKGSGLDAKPAELLSVQAAFFDYDNDGLLDLVVTNYTYWTPQKDQRCARDGSEFYCSPKVYPPVPHSLYKGLGNGKFLDVTEKSGFAAAKGKGMGIGIADFNNDGLTDVFVANDTEPNFLYVNQGNGTFKELGLALGVAYNDSGAVVSAMGCDVKDYDNDGFIDVFYNNLMGQIWGLFRNVRGKSFIYASPATRVAALSQTRSGWSNGFIDYNNDGWKDIYSANGDVDNMVKNARQSDTMFENLDGKRFADVTQEMGKDFLREGYQRGSAFADLNNDGFMDMVVTSLNEKPRIMLNSGSNGNHWLLVSLTGRKSNRDAIAARLKVTTASGRVLHSHVSVSVGFMSTSDRRVHFGLGPENAIASLEITWPSGTKQILENVKPDQILKVEEPQ